MTLAGNDALTRADEISRKLNAFLDATPEMYEVMAGPEGTILGGRDTLLKFVPEDATAQSKTIPDLQKQAIASIRSALYTVAFRIWSTH